MGGLYVSTLLYTIMFVLSWAFCTKSTSLIDGGDCHRNGAYVTWALAAVNLVTDIYLLAIPPFVIAQLQISSKRKSAILLLFFFTTSAIICSVVSVYYRVWVSKNSADFSWNIVPPAIATVAELNLGVICSSLPAINVLFRKAHIQSRNNYATFGTSKTKDSGFFSRVSKRLRFGTSQSTASDEHQLDAERSTIRTEHEIVRLTDIQQVSEPIISCPKNLYPRHYIEERN